MKRIFSFLFISLLALAVWAQQERLTFFTDKDCYVAGERLHLSVVVDHAQSRVAYAELCDTAGLQAAVMVDVAADGTGWADMPLPSTLHSGCYQLAVYTRLMGLQGGMAATKIVGVVNALRVTKSDKIRFLQPQEEAVGLASNYAPGAAVSIALPKDSLMTIRTLSVVRNPLRMKQYEGDDMPVVLPLGIPALPELEGHILAARPVREVATTRIAAIGFAPVLFDGKAQSDGTCAYFTHGMTGTKAIVLNAYDGEGGAVKADFLSPYAELRPARLPELEVACTEAALRERSLGAQQEKALTDGLHLDTLPHAIDFLSRMPEYLYDVDEYARFNTVQEAVTEFVRGVRLHKLQGRTQLFTITADGDAYSHFPALVLLDGMPVSDVSTVLSYDARLLKYIQIYSGSYTFGQTQCHGIISLITHHGLLSNYKLDDGTQFVSYAFPQQRPAFLSPQTSHSGTVLWLPNVGSRKVDFSAPQLPGHYTIVVQGTDASGRAFVSESPLVVTE